MTLAIGLGRCLRWGASLPRFSRHLKLNEAKSNLRPGTAKNSTVVYSTMGDNMMGTIDGTVPAGKPGAQRVDGQFTQD